MYVRMQERFASQAERPTARALRRITLLIGAAAFLMQVLTWSVYAPAMAMGEATVICTMDGMTEVYLGPDGQPVKPEKSKADSKHCGFCVLAKGVSAASPQLMAQPPVRMARHGAETLPGEVIAAGWFLSTLQARGPPTLG